MDERLFLEISTVCLDVVDAVACVSGQGVDGRVVPASVGVMRLGCRSFVLFFVCCCLLGFGLVGDGGF